MHTIRSALLRSGIAHADAEILLAHVLGIPRSAIMAHGERNLTETEEQKFHALVARRKRHEPVAYLTGEKHFYGRTFAVRPGTLIPRPATETLIEEVKRIFSGAMRSEDTPRIVPADAGIVIFTHVRPSSLDSARDDTTLILDIGTGSGCIGITLALELPEITVLCTDIWDTALAIARENAERHGVLDRVKFLRADTLEHSEKPLCGINPAERALKCAANQELAAGGTCAERSRSGPRSPEFIPASSLSVLTRRPFLLVSNPPYVPATTPLPPDVRDFEPREALFAGTQGMDIIERIVSGCIGDPLCSGLALECREEQAKKLVPRFQVPARP